MKNIEVAKTDVPISFEWNWIKCSEQMPPKDAKFLFHYHYGIGLGNWGNHYKIINGNSERVFDGYCLILWPSEINQGQSPFQWTEKDMLEMEVSWMPLPEPPDEDREEADRIIREEHKKMVDGMTEQLYKEFPKPE